MQTHKYSSQNVEVTIPKSLEQLSKSELNKKLFIGQVATRVLKSLVEGFVSEGFEWTLPVIFSKSTDPLWPDPAASIEKRVEVEIYEETVRVTSSMIIHKLVATSLLYPKFFALSPNIRIEKRERKSTGRHIYEFTQLDFETRDSSSQDIMELVERVMRKLLSDLRGKDALEHLGYDGLALSTNPFRVYDREALESKYGKDWEAQIVHEIKEPTWVTNIPREFYDYEDLQGRWDNYDLFLPLYGEVLSGAKREWEYDKILKKIERDGVRKENYRLLLKLAREGRLRPSAGAGIGIERLLSWIVGAKHIGEVQVFPRIPGLVNEL